MPSLERLLAPLENRFLEAPGLARAVELETRSAGAEPTAPLEAES